MYALAALSLVVDQLVVWLVLQYAPEAISQGDRWFVLARQPWSSFAALVILAVLARHYRLAAWGLVLGGALSNLLTYAMRGRAIDYLPFGVVSTNVADLCISLGLIAVGVQVLARQRKQGSE